MKNQLWRTKKGSIVIIDLRNNLSNYNVNAKNYCINFTTKKAVMVTKYKKDENKMSGNKQLKLMVLKHDL